jgi:hypothetical protein
MKDLCKIMGNVVMVLGTIGSFAIAYQNGLVIRTSMYSIRPERSWVMTIAWFLGAMLSVMILCTILYSIADVLDNQERLFTRLVENDNKIETKLFSNGDEVKKDHWKCPKCGAMNPNYTGTCSCGYSKH